MSGGCFGGSSKREQGHYEMCRTLFKHISSNQIQITNNSERNWNIKIGTNKKINQYKCILYY